MRLLSVPFIACLPLFAGLVVALGTIAPTGAMAQTEAFETRAPRALLVDFESGSVLYEKAADSAFEPGNLAKLMTLAVVFDALSDERITLSTEFKVSENAWRAGGAPSGNSTMFAEINSDVAVRDLIKGAIIHYGNDAYIALAEGLAGTETSFATLMNEFAVEIGMTNSTFVNATGYTNPRARTTARDMARLATYIIRNHPQLFRTFKTEDFEWNGIYQRNRNPMLGLNIGADGMMTATTESSGYSLVTTTLRDDRRQIVVVSGLETPAQRVVDARRTLNWGLNGFEPLVVFDDGARLGEARVFGGRQIYVDVVGDGEIRALLPREGGVRLSAQIEYQAPLSAPISAGEQIGYVQISRDGQPARRAPVYAGEDVPKGNLAQRALSSVIELVVGLFAALIPS